MHTTSRERSKNLSHARVRLGMRLLDRQCQRPGRPIHRVYASVAEVEQLMDRHDQREAPLSGPDRPLCPSQLDAYLTFEGDRLNSIYGHVVVGAGCPVLQSLDQVEIDG